MEINLSLLYIILLIYLSTKLSFIGLRTFSLFPFIKAFVLYLEFIFGPLLTVLRGGIWVVFRGTLYNPDYTTF